uniref:CASP-like protein n=1 Tax=Oryza nivara TaxID=4536 RepID=A0A0E0FSJ8_ORYNI
MGSIGNGRNGSEVGIQIPAMGNKEVLERPAIPRWPRLGVVMVATRAVALVMAVLSMALMISAKQRGSLKIFGIEIPLYANWSFSDSLEYLVGMSAVSAAYCLAQLLLTAHKAVKNAPVVQSRNYAWLLFTGDQDGGVAGTGRVGGVRWHR